VSLLGENDRRVCGFLYRGDEANVSPENRSLAGVFLQSRESDTASEIDSADSDAETVTPSVIEKNSDGREAGGSEPFSNDERWSESDAGEASAATALKVQSTISLIFSYTFEAKEVLFSTGTSMFNGVGFRSDFRSGETMRSSIIRVFSLSSLVSTVSKERYSCWGVSEA